MRNPKKPKRGLLAIDHAALGEEIGDALASQREVATRAGIPASTLNRILNRRSHPLPSTVRQIVKALVECRQEAGLTPRTPDELFNRIVRQREEVIAS